MKKRRIKWSLYAKFSLDSIVAYIEIDSPSNARLVKRTLVMLVGSLIDFPEKFPVDPFISRSKGNFRYISKWNYKIVYEITLAEIIVIDIFHTAQNPEKIEDAFY